MRPHTARLIVVAVTATIVTSCTSPPRPSFTLSDFRDIPAKRLESYAFDPEKEIADRIAPMPEFLLNFLREVDGVAEYSDYDPTPGQRRMIREYLSLLPPLHRRVLGERLIALHFVESFLGSGMADFVVDENNELYVILYFNPDTLTETMSERLTYRESTCFNAAEDSSVSVAIDCGDSYSGFMYILLHETTHAVDYIAHATPYVEPILRDIGLAGQVEATAFTSEVWADYARPEEKHDFPSRDEVTFYGLSGGPKLPIARAIAVYDELAETPFVSLYASMNWAEDLAEYLTWFHFANVLDQPYEIRVSRNGLPVKTYRPMEFPHVAEREETIAAFYVES